MLLKTLGKMRLFQESNLILGHGTFYFKNKSVIIVGFEDLLKP